MHGGFPGCCTAKVVYGFGEEGYVQATKVACRLAIKDAISYGRSRGEAMIVATSTKGQHKLNETLLEFGFKRTKWMSKAKCPSTKVALWHLHLETK